MEQGERWRLISCVGMAGRARNKGTGGVRDHWEGAGLPGARWRRRVAFGGTGARGSGGGSRERAGHRALPSDGRGAPPEIPRRGHRGSMFEEQRSSSSGVAAATHKDGVAARRPASPVAREYGNVGDVFSVFVSREQKLSFFRSAVRVDEPTHGRWLDAS